MMVAEATSLSSILDQIGTVFTALIGYVGSICETIVSNPLLLLGTAIPITFAIVKFVKKIYVIRKKVYL